MNYKLKRSLSILLVTCLVAMCSISHFRIEVHAAETSISAVWKSVTGTEATFNFTEANQENCSANLAVSAFFPINNVEAGTKRITIKPADGLAWSQTSSSSSLSDYISSIDTLQDATVIEGTNVVLNNATHVYHIVDSVDSMTLNLSFLCDARLHLSSITDAVKLNASYIDKSGISHSSDFSINATIFENAGVLTQTGSTATQKTTCGNVTMITSDIKHKFGVFGVYDRYFENLQMKLRLPKDVTYVKDRNNLWEVTNIEEGEDTHTYTLEVNNHFARKVYIDPVFNIPSTYKLNSQIPVYCLGVKITFFNGVEENLTKEYCYTFEIDNSTGLRLNGCKPGSTSATSYPTTTIKWTRPDTYHGVSGIYDDAEGVLGCYGVANSSSSQPFYNKRLKINFDSEKIHVHGVKLYVGKKGDELDVTFNYKLTPDSPEQTKTVTLNTDDWTPQNKAQYGFYYLYTGHEGLPADAIITKVDYVIPNIISNAQTTTCYYYGNIADKEALINSPATTTLVMSDDEDPDFIIKTKSLTKIDTTKHEGILSYYLNNNSTQVIDAGNTLSVGIRVYGDNYAHSFTPTPIYYLRDETGLGISNIVIKTQNTTIGAKSAHPIPSKVIYDEAKGFNPYGIVVTELERQDDGARLYQIDTTPVALSSDPYAAAIGLFDSKYAATANTQMMQINYTVETTKAYFDDSADHSKSQIVFIADGGNAFTNFSSYKANTFYVGDPYDVNQNHDTKDINIIAEKERMAYYNITNKYGIQLKTTIEDPATSSYKNVIDKDHAVDISNTDTIIKSTLINTSHTDINSFCIYIPIPKKNENWGKYLLNDQPLQVSAVLTGPVQNPRRQYFSVTYGQIPMPSDPSTINTTLDNFTSWTEYDEAERENYNCIRITNQEGIKIPCDVTYTEETNAQAFIENNSYHFTAPIAYDSQATSGQNYSLWKSFFTDQFQGPKNMITLKFYGSPIGVTSEAVGTIKGCVWNDLDGNGIREEIENDMTNVENWSVELYDSLSYGKNYAKPLATTKTDSEGNYRFNDLEFPSDYIVVLANSDAEKYIFTQNTANYEIVKAGETHTHNTAFNLDASSGRKETIVNFGFQSVDAPSPSPSLSPSPSTSASPGGSCCCCCCCCHCCCCHSTTDGTCCHNTCNGTCSQSCNVDLQNYMNYLNSYYNNYYNNFYNNLYSSKYNSNSETDSNGNIINNFYYITYYNGEPTTYPVPPVITDLPVSPSVSPNPSPVPSSTTPARSAAPEANVSSVPASPAALEANVSSVTASPAAIETNVSSVTASPAALEVNVSSVTASPAAPEVNVSSVPASPAAIETNVSSVPASPATIETNVSSVAALETNASSIIDSMEENTSNLAMAQSLVKFDSVQESLTETSNTKNQPDNYYTNTKDKAMLLNKDATKVTSIIIPNNVKTLESKCFANADKLKNVIFLSNTPVDFTNGASFAKCKNLTVKVPKKALKAYKNKYKSAIEAKRISLIGY